MAKKRKKDYLGKIVPRLNLDPDTKRGIFIVSILAIAAISQLSLFDLAGPLGTYLSRAMIASFGWGKWVFPPLLFLWAINLYAKERKLAKGASYLGGFLFLLTIESLFHLFINQNQWQTTIAIGAGGGYLGYTMVIVLTKIVGFVASWVIVIALLLVSLMLMFNKSLTKLFGRESWLAKIVYPINFLIAKIFRRRGEEESDDTEEEEEDTEEEPADTGEETDEEEEVDESVDVEDEEAKLDFKNKTIEEPEFMKPAVVKKQSVKSKAILPTETGWEPTGIKLDIPLDLLSGKIGKPTSGDIKENAIIIKRTLENFGIPVEMGEVLVGPTVTQFTFKPSEGIKLSRITTLSNNLALALAAHPIRIEAPIPGKALVGIEVPNQIKAVVGLKEILSDEKYRNRKSNMIMALGKDVSGNSWMDDITKMPHLLVAGATNSGKSVCLNTIIISLLYQNNPDDVRFIMVDPKRVELFNYNGIPHLVTPVITDIGKTVNALKWCIKEMEKRLEIFEKGAIKNIVDYNKAFKHKLPYIVFIIDELADLMVMAGKDIEASIIRLAQKARAVGIHLILATQDPRAEVVTGLIKANMPGRIAFSVASGVNSRIILDALGADKLLGRGDMLFKSPEMSQPRRLQGAYVSDNEIKKIVAHIKDQSGRQTFFVKSILEKQKVAGLPGSNDFGSDGDDDDLLEEAKEEIINSGKASASYLQRRLRIGYARAASILDQLERQGVIGEGNGAKGREVLISKEQYASMISQGVSGVSLHKQEEAVAPDEYLPSEEEDEEEDEEDSSASSGQAEEEEKNDPAGSEEPEEEASEEESPEEPDDGENEDESDDEEGSEDEEEDPSAGSGQDEEGGEENEEEENEKEEEPKPKKIIKDEKPKEKNNNIFVDKLFSR